MGDKVKKTINRRSFMENSGKGAVAIAAMTAAPAFLVAKSPNEVIGVGHVGCGVRGGQLVTMVAGEPERGRPGIENTQIRAICDIYKPHLEKGVKNSGNPAVTRYHEYEKMLEDKNIDAVIIATPDHWHAPMLIDAANAGKDIYVEKCWTRTLPEAKSMLKAIKYNSTVMQLGHDRSSSAAIQARELIKQNILGEITLVEIDTFRNRLRGSDEWRWYGFYNIFERPDEEMVRANLDWKRYLGSAPYHPFSMERFWHWRCYWDYGTGISGDLLSHSFDYINYVLELGIPHACTTAGSINFLDDGRECPDTWHSIFQYPERKMSVLYSSSFNTEFSGSGLQGSTLRGKDACMKLGARDFEVFAESNTQYKDKIDSGEIKPSEPIARFDPAKTPSQPSHMQDFFDCMRTRKQPKDNEDEAFVEAVVCIMSVESFFKKRTVTWDAERQEIV
jgi:predicted dehydrogenase